MLLKLNFLWYDNFGENQTPLQGNGMAAIPKRLNCIDIYFIDFFNISLMTCRYCKDVKNVSNIGMVTAKLLRILINHFKTVKYQPKFDKFYRIVRLNGAIAFTVSKNGLISRSIR